MQNPHDLAQKFNGSLSVWRSE